MTKQRAWVQRQQAVPATSELLSHRHLQKQRFGPAGSGPESWPGQQSNTDLAERSAPFNFGQIPIGDASPPLQAKLTIGQANDPYEQEADRVAHRVVQQIHSPQLQQTSADGELQRPRQSPTRLAPIMRRADADAVSGEASAAFEQRLNLARAGGAPLNPALRPMLEASMGADFSGVKVHTDAQADQLSQSIQAKAFTTGRDVFFKQGEYNPSSRTGQELIAHELTHVVQQNSGTLARSLIQRDGADGQPVPLGADFTAAAFRSKTAVTAATRGEYLSTIDRWMEAIAGAQTWDDQQYALAQARAACNAWLQKHGTTDTPGEPSSVKARRAPIVATYQALNGQLTGAGGTVVYASPAGGTAKGTRHQAGRVREGGDGITEAIGGTGGSAGDFDDANAKANHGKGSAVGDAVHSDLLDGANMLGGISSMHRAYKGLTDDEASDFEKADAVGQGVGGVGKLAHGGLKASRGIASLKQGGGDNLSSGWQGTGELGAVIGDSTAAFAGLIATARGIHDFIENYQETTSQEKLEQGLDLAENLSTTAQSGVKVGLGIYKTSQEFAGASVSADTVSSLGSVAAILGLITGSIQIVQGGFQLYRGFSAGQDIKNAEQEKCRLISGVRGNLSQLSLVLDDPFWLQCTPQPEIDAVGTQLRILQETLEQLQALETTYAPAMAAMKKVSSRRMEEGAMKAAGGALGVVGSALTLSGVGAPIGLAIGALAGILALGHAGVNLARNTKAGDLTTIATRLTTDGKPKGDPDNPEPSYREMEKRIYKCYYNHIPQVLVSQAPPGLGQDNFTKVKQFAWEDKKSRVESLDKALISSPAGASQLSEEIRRNKWIEVQDASGTATHKEKPKGFDKISLTFSASAHKSKQSLNASKEEIAAALTMLGMQSYDSSLKDFVNAPIIPQGVADPEMLKQYGQLTLKTLLSTAGISTARWEKWMQEAMTASIPSVDLSQFMQKKIMNHI